MPFGAVTAAFIIFFFSSPKRAKVAQTDLKGKIAQLDVEGTVLFIPAIICLLLALLWGGSRYEWGNGRIIALFVLFAVLTAGFIGVQLWKQEAATVPPRILKNRTVSAGAFFGACLGGTFFLMIYFVSKKTAPAVDLPTTDAICRSPSGFKPSRACRPPSRAS